MDQVSISGLSGVNGLTGNGTTSSSLLKSRGSDALTDIASKRSSDRIKFTHLMLKTRLAQDLDSTLAGHLEQNPQMKDDFFISIFTDDGYGVEVVDAATAKGMLSKLPTDRQESQGQDPIGYFSRKEFPAKTPDSDAHRELRDKLNQYFKRNAEVIGYLRDNPDADVDPTTLYTQPST